MLRIISFLVTSGLLLTDATPNCQSISSSNIVCTPGNEDYVLRRGLVSERNDVTHITLRSCRITEVEYEAFHLLPNLYSLDLSQNKIKTFKLGVLDGFNDLKIFNLSYNEITDFPPGLFDSKYNLELLDLKGNRLTNIHIGTLYPMKKLKHLDISSNSYLGRHLNPDIFNYTKSIGFMDFSRNDMTESKENLLAAFTEVNFLNLDRCSLQEVPAFAVKPNLKTMKFLWLSSNRIKSINDRNTFSNLEELEMLNLVSNSIDYIVNDVFSPLKKLKVIMLIDNRLKQIPDRLFRSMPMLTDVDISRNALENLPVNAFRGSPIGNLILSHNKLTFLPDNFCLELANSGAKLSKFYFDDNPWQCACLRDILIEMKQYEINYNSEKFNGRNPVCVTTKEFNCKRQENINSYYTNLYYNLVE